MKFSKEGKRPFVVEPGTAGVRCGGWTLGPILGKQNFEHTDDNNLSQCLLGWDIFQFKMGNY